MLDESTVRKELSLFLKDSSQLAKHCFLSDATETPPAFVCQEAAQIALHPAMIGLIPIPPGNKHILLISYLP